MTLNRIGDVLRAQGQLVEAHAAFAEALAITRRLTERDPSNAGWQRELAQALDRVGDVLQTEGQLAGADGLHGSPGHYPAASGQTHPNNAG